MKTGLLLAAALFLAAFIYFRPHPGFVLSDNPLEKADTIRIDRPGMAEILLEKKGPNWEIGKPARGLARPEAVRNVLSILEAKSEKKLDATDLSRFGLDRPVLRLFIDNEEFDFGMLNPVTGQQYVKKGNSVYLISAGYGLIPALSELEADRAGAS